MAGVFLGGCALVVGDVSGHAALGASDASATPDVASSSEAGAALDASDATVRTDGQVDAALDSTRDAGADSSGDSGGPAPDAGSRYASVVLADHPLAYWRLDEASRPGPALDSTGNGHTGLYAGDASLGVPGLLVGDPDLAAAFDGVSSGVNLATAPAFDLSGKAPFSIEAWIKPASNIDNASSYPRIFDRESGDGTHTWGYGLWLVDLTPAIARFYLDMTTGMQVQWTAIATGAPAAIGQVTYVAGTYDGATESIYVDGVLIATAADTLALRSYPGLSADIAAEGPGQSTTYYPFGGTIDEVAIYPAALSAARVLAHYNAGTGH
jgi:hypothetical protein